MLNETANIINLKGFMVGNGVTNWKYDADPAWVDTLNGFKMISSVLYDSIQANNCTYLAR
jgi:hypothetical protein